MVNVGVIGCGGRIEKLLRILLSINPEVELSSAYDPSAEAIDRYRKTFGIEFKIYENLKDLLESKVDWVLIGSWNCFHANSVIEALELGKNVFCEKPLAISVEEYKRIFEAAKKSKGKLLVGFTLRHSPHYLKIKEIVSQGVIGKVISFEFNEILTFDHGSKILSDWRRFEKNSGGHLLEKCCHDFDVANWILEDVPLRIASFGKNSFFVGENEDLDDSIIAKKAEKDVMDNQVAILEFSKGARASFHTNCASGLPQRRIYICGTKGSLEADVLSGKIQVGLLDGAKKDYSVYEGGSGHGDGDKFLVNNLSNAIKGKDFLKIGINESILSGVSCLRADEARKTNSVLNLSKDWEFFDFSR